MPFRFRRALPAWAAVLLAFYFLFFFGLTGTGLLGPDEPRYAAIGREMTRSGDWVTPRLWGQPWFEKPPLVYWMTAAGFRLGLGEELAPRLPVALISVAFLLFYYWALRRELGARAALYAAAILGTSVGWLAFSHVGVTDLPMAAAFSAAMLLCLPWIDRGERRGLTAAGALLGLAVLAKGLVPLVLALPLLWAGRRRRLSDLLRPGPVLAFVVVAVPWYALVTVRNGRGVLEDFFLKHHLERFATEALQHQQPFWFYAPVLLAGIYPWTPLAALLFRRRFYKDAVRRFLLLWLLFGFVFFSAAANKLPGYLLPLVPAASALLGLALAEAGRGGMLLAACAALLGLMPAIQATLPGALLRGISHTSVPGLVWAAPAGIVFAAVVWQLERRRRRVSAVAAMVLIMTAGVIWIETRTYPVLDRVVSARGVWREVSAQADRVCVGRVNRGWRYNLNYYSIVPLPECEDSPRPLRIEQDSERGPRIENRPPPARVPQPTATWPASASFGFSPPAPLSPSIRGSASRLRARDWRRIRAAPAGPTWNA